MQLPIGFQWGEVSRIAVDAGASPLLTFTMANLSLYSDVSKTDLAERYERMKAASRSLARKNEEYIAKGLGMLAAGAGGAAAAAVNHVSHKVAHPNVAAKIPWIAAAAVDVAALMFDGSGIAEHAIGAFGHGYTGYLSGKETEKILP